MVEFLPNLDLTCYMVINTEYTAEGLLLMILMFLFLHFLSLCIYLTHVVLMVYTTCVNG